MDLLFISEQHDGKTVLDNKNDESKKQQNVAHSIIILLFTWLSIVLTCADASMAEL